MSSRAPSKYGAFTGTSLICTGHWERRLVCWACGVSTAGGGGRRIIPGLAAGAAAGQGHVRFLHFTLFVFHDGLLVIGRRLPLYKGDGPGGAGGQAVAQTVAVIVPHEPRLAVHHGDGALVTGGGAGAAAVAFFLIDLDDPSNHFDTPLRFLLTL